MSQSLTMPVDCASCKGPVLVEIARDQPAPSAQYWRCPYCAEINPGAYDGQVLWVTKHFQQQPQTTQ